MINEQDELIQNLIRDVLQFLLEPIQDKTILNPLPKVVRRVNSLRAAMNEERNTKGLYTCFIQN